MHRRSTGGLLAKHPAQQPGWGLALGFVAAQLLVVAAVYRAHASWSAAREQGLPGAWEPAPAALNPAYAPESVGGVVPRLAEADIALLAERVAAMVGLNKSAEGEGAPSVGFGSPMPGPPAGVVSMTDEPFGRNPSSNIPGVEDIHAELQAYARTLAAELTPSAEGAAARQRRPTAAQLGISADDPLNDVSSIPTRIEFLNELAEEADAAEAVRVAIVATVAADLAGVRRELLPWLQYHTALGVTQFYLLYDGNDQAAVDALQSIRHVELMHIHEPWATPVDAASFHAYHAATVLWAGRSGNFELMFKQGYGLDEALRRSKAAGVHWLLHLDPDELFLPGGGAASLSAELGRQPAHVPAVRFMNFEGQPEAGDLVNRYEQVTLFRVHKHFITPEAFHYRAQWKLGANAAFLMLYANGKTAVRVDAPGVRQAGPHYFTGDASPRWQTPEKPSGAWHNAVSDVSVVLHYAYSYSSDVAAKAGRSCPGNFTAAARAGNRELVKAACFVIDFDADAYMAAAKGAHAVADFFHTRMVLSEGSPVACSDLANPGRQGWCALQDVPRFIYLMEKVGLVRRVLMPQVLLRQQERAIRRRRDVTQQ